MLLALNNIKYHNKYKTLSKVFCDSLIRINKVISTINYQCKVIIN